MRSCFFSSNIPFQLRLCSWQFMMHCWPHVDNELFFFLRWSPMLLTKAALNTRTTLTTQTTHPTLPFSDALHREWSTLFFSSTVTGLLHHRNTNRHFFLHDASNSPTNDGPRPTHSGPQGQCFLHRELSGRMVIVIEERAERRVRDDERKREKKIRETREKR